MIEQTPDELRLVLPSSAYEATYRSLVAECVAAGEGGFSQRFQDYDESFGAFDAYLRWLADCANGRQLPPGHVPWQTFWLVSGAEVVGESHLRFRLSYALEHEGGHIGYLIRPSTRRRGYATRLLAMTLEQARERRLRRVLVTCDTDNIGSAKVIEANRGTLENRVRSHHTGKLVSRYWIEV